VWGSRWWGGDVGRDFGDARGGIDAGGGSKFLLVL